MFNVNRYDPDAQKQKAKRKDDSKTNTNTSNSSRQRQQQQQKRVRNQQQQEHGDNHQVRPRSEQQQQQQQHPVAAESEISTLRVIANETMEPSSLSSMLATTTNATTSKQHLLSEAFDDLDILLMGEKDKEEEEDMIEKNTTTATITATTGIEPAEVTKTKDKNNEILQELSMSDIQTAVSISQMPMEQVSNAWKLQSFLIDNLRRGEGSTTTTTTTTGFQHFFPIQALVIPHVIASERHAQIMKSHDICITAPTGSGKTLAYVLPIINALAAAASVLASTNTGDSNHRKHHLHQQRQQHRLRALILLPSRDLATQVYKVVEQYVVGSTLTVGIAIGQSDFVTEQKALTVVESSLSSSSSSSNIRRQQMLHNRLSYDPGNLELALQLLQYQTSAPCLDSPSSKSYIPKDGWSNIDILVGTPGRLVDHLDHTPGFTLQHLRYLVVDEADRLLSQSYHGWIDRVIDATNQASVNAWKDIIMRNGKLPPLLKVQNSDLNPSIGLEPITWRRGGVNGDHDDNHHRNDGDYSVSNQFINTANISRCSAVSKICQPIQLRKFLVSATLTRDPQKLASLRLVNPKHFNVHKLAISSIGSNSDSNKYSMPPSLEEYVVECTAEQKPMVLLSLLIERMEKRGNIYDDTLSGSAAAKRKSMTVIFTSSLDSTHRLARLLQLLWGTLHYGSDSVGEFSSALNQQERAELMKRCIDPTNHLSIIVCSDGMSRGMDLDFVDTVINYDIPTLAKTYVHRCGRTARASRKGTAISLLKGGQNSLFYRMRNLVQESQRVQNMAVKKNSISNALDVYRLCIKALREVLEAEANGEIGHRETISSYLPDS